MKKTLLASFLSILILTSFGVVVYANGGVSNPGNDGGMSNPANDGGVSNPGNDGGMSNQKGVISLDNPFRTGGSLIELLNAVFDDIIFPIGGILAVLAFIYSGFMYVTAQGDTGKIGDAHRALLYSAIGTAILLGARVISLVISNTVDKLKT